jgi:hypothetical protein
LARRSKPIPPEEIDLTNTDKRYWDEILKSYGLGMDRGRNPSCLAYIGDVQDVDKLAKEKNFTAEGRAGLSAN